MLPLLAATARGRLLLDARPPIYPPPLAGHADAAVIDYFDGLMLAFAIPAAASLRPGSRSAA